jgi:hypothetical protein
MRNVLPDLARVRASVVGEIALARAVLQRRVHLITLAHVSGRVADEDDLLTRAEEAPHGIFLRGGGGTRERDRAQHEHEPRDEREPVARHVARIR